MSAAAESIIHQLAGSGIRLSRNGDRLRIEAKPGTLTDDLKAKLTAIKPALLLALDSRTNDHESIRHRLHALAAAEGIDSAMVERLDNDDLIGCIGLSCETLIAYIRAMRDTALRERGQRPADETARALCRSCGPIWLHPSVAAVAPLVNGWPFVLGCPWCHVRNRSAIPRPSIASQGDDNE